MDKKQNKPTIKWFLLGSALVITAAAVYFAVVSSGIPVETATVSTGEVVKMIKESGSVEAKKTVILTAKSTGEVKGLMVGEGDPVRAGDLLMAGYMESSAALDIKSMQAQLRGLQVQYAEASDLAAKNKILYEEGAISYQLYSQSRNIANQLAAQIDALNYSIKSYAASTGSSGITAAIDGVITEVFAKEGETVLIGSPLFEIADLEDIYIATDLIAADADLVSVGDPVRVYNEDTGFDSDLCTVSKIYLKAEEKISDLGISQKRVRVEILLSNDQEIRLGSGVDIEITIEKKENALRVSDMALFEMDKEKYVYVVQQGKAVLRKVETGLEGEDYSEILSGLSEGETVIVSPSTDIGDGVRIKEDQI